MVTTSSRTWLEFPIPLTKEMLPLLPDLYATLSTTGIGPRLKWLMRALKLKHRERLAVRYYDIVVLAFKSSRKGMQK